MSGCNCGSSCNCGSNCGCGKMYPDIDVEQSTAQAIIIEGVAPSKMYAEGSETSFVTEGGHACKCGSSCTCNPCNC